jgi:hypothetical protein
MATRRYYSAIAVDNTVASGINSSVTSVTLTASPVGFPGSFPFVVALDFDTASEELVLVTAASGPTFTITRGYNGTSATSHNAGAVVRHVFIAQDMTDFQDHAAGTTSVHGITDTSALITASSTTTMINKTLTSPVVNTPTISSPKTTITINAQSGTSYTLAGSDQDALVTLSNSNPITLTVPPSVFSAGQYVNIQQVGTGQVTVAAGSGVTITGTGTKLRNQYSAAVILCTGSNTFTLIGDIL